MRRSCWKAGRGELRRDNKGSESEDINGKKPKGGAPRREKYPPSETENRRWQSKLSFAIERKEIDKTEKQRTAKNVLQKDGAQRKAPNNALETIVSVGLRRVNWAEKSFKKKFGKDYLRGKQTAKKTKKHRKKKFTTGKGGRRLRAFSYKLDRENDQSRPKRKPTRCGRVCHLL